MKQRSTTDGTGAYSFNGLDPLVWYAVEELQPTTPAGLAQGPTGLVSCRGGLAAKPAAVSLGLTIRTALALSSCLCNFLIPPAWL